jgi:hypothetical protein
MRGHQYSALEDIVLIPFQEEDTSVADLGLATTSAVDVWDPLYIVSVNPLALAIGRADGLQGADCSVRAQPFLSNPRAGPTASMARGYSTTTRQNRACRGALSLPSLMERCVWQPCIEARRDRNVSRPAERRGE